MRNNPIIPVGAITMPPGFPMKIPISYRNPWGSAYQILPDALFAYGPYDASFNARAEVDRKPGWFKYYSTYVSGRNRRGGEIVRAQVAGRWRTHGDAPPLGPLMPRWNWLTECGPTEFQRPNEPFSPEWSWTFESGFLVRSASAPTESDLLRISSYWGNCVGSH